MAHFSNYGGGTDKQEQEVIGLAYTHVQAKSSSHAEEAQ